MWHIIDERIQRLTAAKAKAVLVGDTTELSPGQLRAILTPDRYECDIGRIPTRHPPLHGSSARWPSERSRASPR